MTLRGQLRFGGLWVIVASLLMNTTNIMVYAGRHTAAIQAVYGIGLTGLILSSTFIHSAQARRAGLFGLVAYLVSGLSLAYVNVVTFLTLAEMTGIEEAHQASLGIWEPAMKMAVYGAYIGLMLLGISVAQAGVFPRWAGILTALGIAIQLPAQFAITLAGPMFFIFTMGGSILFGAGLTWIGWTLWSNHFSLDKEPRLSNLDRGWGGVLVIITALILIVNAYINTFGQLNLTGGIINLLEYSALILAIPVLYNAQANRAGGLGLTGFVFTHLGATLTIIPAYLIMAQLAGQIENNVPLMASWVDIPVGRYGSYMIILGVFLFGISAIRADVFPRWAGWLIVIGIAIMLPSQFQAEAYMFLIFWVIGATLEGIGIGWMGWTLLKKNPLVE